MARERVIVYLEPATIEQLRQLGKRQDQNLSGVIRSIIAQRLQHPLMQTKEEWRKGET